MQASSPSRIEKKHLAVIFAAFALGLGIVLWSSQGPPGDAELRARVAGTWMLEITNGQGAAFSARGPLAVFPDGTFEMKPALNVSGEQKQYTYRGLWEITNGFFITAVTNSNFPLAPAGRLLQHRILRVDNKEFVYQSEAGQTITCTRSH